MKTLLTISIFLIFTAFTVAQRDSTANLTIGINTTSSISFYGNGNNISFIPNANFVIKKHELSIGPCLQLFQNISHRNELNKWTITGTNLVYNYYPNAKNKIIDFYLQFNFIYQHFINKFDRWTYVENSYESYLGYGFKIKLLKGFYINQSMCLGIIKSYQNSNIGADYDKIYEWTEAGFIIKGGLGYQFN